MTEGKLALPPLVVERAVAAALAEDLGQAGDITTDAIVPTDHRSEARIVARKAGVIAGLALAEASFKALDPECSFERSVDDGAKVAAGEAVATITGKTRALLSAERIALNFLGRLSGIATLTAPMLPPSKAPRPASSARARRPRACGRWRNTRSAPGAAPITASGSTTRCW